MRAINIELGSILELVNCSEGYGFSDDVLLSAFGEFTGFVSDEEITEYASWFSTDEAEEMGYSLEDQENAIEVITEWRDRYASSRV